MRENPFHPGERKVQQRAAEMDEANRNSAMITPFIPRGAIPFLKQQPLLILGIFHKGEMWCLPASGHPGWMTAIPDSIELDLTQALVPLDERILQAADEQQAVGGIVLDFATRRRLRINGRLERSGPGLMVLKVGEAYPNCPKYITQRSLVCSERFSAPLDTAGASLTQEQRAMIEMTDILFIATQHSDRGLDASHRGGNPGFVQSLDETTISFPDYRGNSLFNTLGNLEIDSRASVLVPDFKHGQALVLTGKATVTYSSDGHARTTTMAVSRWNQIAIPISETSRRLSPFNPSIDK